MGENWLTNITWHPRQQPSRDPCHDRYEGYLYDCHANHRYLIDKWGRVPTILLSLFLGGVVFLLIGICPSPFTGLIFLAIILAGFGMSGQIIGANTLAVDAAPPGLIGSILGGRTPCSLSGFSFLWASVAILWCLWSWLGIRDEGCCDPDTDDMDVYGKGTPYGRAWKRTLDSLNLTMEWEDEAKKMLEKVPAAFREAAVTGTEEYAKDDNHERLPLLWWQNLEKSLGCSGKQNSGVRTRKVEK